MNRSAGRRIRLIRSRTARIAVPAASVLMATTSAIVVNVLTSDWGWLWWVLLGLLVTLNVPLLVRVTSSDDDSPSSTEPSVVPVTNSYVGTMQGTPLRLATQNVKQIFELVRIDDFTGRAWLVEQYTDFTARHDRGYFLVEAEAGLGKTSFAAWLIARHDYLGHFTRLTGGRDRRNALLNLSAQLIIDLDLYPDMETQFVLPGLDRNVVPQWAGDPANFARLLDLAAQKAASLNRSITLIVDGLDEEQPPSTPVPLGLPASLPRGVWIIATCRTGTPVALNDTAVGVARISADDPRNLADMREYLSAATAQPDLLRRLDENSMTTEQFISRIIDQCGGVWVYLSYLLPDLISGELTLDDLDRLPAKLSQYFAANLARRRTDPLWTMEDLPLLGTLAAVFEPVGTAMLSKVTGLGQPAVRRVCEQRYRAFLRVAHVDGYKRFAVYHRSLNDFLSGHVADEVTVPEATRDLTDELSEHVVNAHHRIADFYLAQFDHPTDPRALVDQHDGYGLRHLTAHLRKAGRHLDVRRVLYPDRLENRLLAWHAEHGDVDAYTQDIMLAIGPARQRTDQEPSPHTGLESLRFEVYATLFLAGQTVDAENSSVELIGSLLEFGVWDIETALAHVSTIGNPALRTTSLLATLPYVPDRETHLRQAQATADHIRNPVDQVFARTALLHHVRANAAETHAQLVQQARELTDPIEAAHAMTALLAHRPGDHQLFQEAVDRLRRAQDPISRAYGLAEAVPFAPPPDVEALVLEALDLPVPQAEAPVLAGLEVPDIDHRTAIAAGLLASAPAALGARLWDEVYAAEVPEAYEGVRRLVILARHASGAAVAKSLTRQALLLARDIPDSHIAARAMVMVFGSLAASGLNQAH
jgi:hypothetical protein